MIIYVIYDYFYCSDMYNELYFTLMKVNRDHRKFSDKFLPLMGDDNKFYFEKEIVQIENESWSFDITALQK